MAVSSTQQKYRKLSPAGEVPTLVHEGRALGQSMAILEYLDDVFPQQALFPKNPLDRAHVRQVCEGINCAHSLQNLKVTQYLEKQMAISAEQKEMWLFEWMGRIFESTEALIQSSAGSYAFGDTVSAADLFIVPQVFSAQRVQFDISKYSTIQRVNENCLKISALQAAHPYRQIDTPAELRI